MAGVPHDEASAVVLLRQAALGGEVAAQLAMGYRYLYVSQRWYCCNASLTWVVGCQLWLWRAQALFHGCSFL